MKEMNHRDTGMLALICILFFIVRLYIASISSYSFYHGWNEGHYSLIAAGYFDHSLMRPERDGIMNWAVPPLYSWIVFGFFKIFGMSDISARLSSIFATIFTIPFIYILAKELYDKNVASLSSITFLFIPWVLHLSGRVQTDMTMTAFITASIASFIYAHNHQRIYLFTGLFLGLAIFTKQTAILTILVVGICIGYNNRDRLELMRRLTLPILIGLVPFVFYILYHIHSGDSTGVIQLIYGEAVHRTSIFSNWKNTILGILAGITPLILFMAIYEIYRSRDYKNILTLWLLIYGFFMIARTPVSHEYYILPLAVPFSILSAKGTLSSPLGKKGEIIAAIIIILSTIPASYIFLSYTGDLGYTCAEDVIDYLSKFSKEKILIVTPDKYAPELEWYLRLKDVKGVVRSINDDLSAVGISDLLKIVESYDADRVFLVIDGRGDLEDRLEHDGYKSEYTSSYYTKMPEIFANIYTGDVKEEAHFEQHLSVYELM